jgi:hypothetical protein
MLTHHHTLDSLGCLPAHLDVYAGGFFSLFSKLWSEKEMRILILGLDGAGKTTILYRLQVGEVVTTIPSECARCLPLLLTWPALASFALGSLALADLGLPCFRQP